jgi:Cytochrome c554 and c-prime
MIAKPHFLAKVTFTTALLGLMAGLLIYHKPVVHTLVPAPKVAAPLVAAPFQQLSAAGCAAAKCHGAAIPFGDHDPKQTWSWAATVWRIQDKHSLAYRTLLTCQSQAILDRLHDKTPAEKNPRCLGCHSDPTLAHLDATPALDQLRSAGVSCRSCHGDSDRWLIPHLNWNENTNRQVEYATHGMIWLNDLQVRAKVCAGCHVGAAANKDIKVDRIVDHDLIAAGHPRLNFEFATYLRAMPPHWNEMNRMTRKPIANFATRAWSAGQLASLQTALDLLAARLEKDQFNQVRPWPEFSEFNCFDCHHDLSGVARKVPAAGGLRSKRGSTAWYQDMLFHPTARGKSTGEFLLEMQQRHPRADQLRKMIPTVRLELKAPPAIPEKLLPWLRQTVEKRELLNWDEAAWLYHGLVAVELSRYKNQALADEKVNKLFDNLSNKLRLDLVKTDPTGIRYNSPKHYYPAEVRAYFLELMQRLETLLKAGPKGKKPMNLDQLGIELSHIYNSVLQ